MNNRSVETPAWMSGTLQVNGALSITYNRAHIVIFTLIVFAILQMVLKRTRLGLDIRAVTQNRAMAQAMGIRTEWVDAMTFGLGSGIAGVAGVALSQFTNVGPNLGQSYHHEHCNKGMHENNPRWIDVFGRLQLRVIVKQTILSAEQCQRATVCDRHREAGHKIFVQARDKKTKETRKSWPQCKTSSCAISSQEWFALQEHLTAPLLELSTTIRL